MFRVNVEMEGIYRNFKLMNFRREQEFTSHCSVWNGDLVRLYALSRITHHRTRTRTCQHLLWDSCYCMNFYIRV
jgi:hypothetical protein